MATGKGDRRSRKDVDAVLDELYATPPAGFVERREELAAEAKADGRPDDARRLHQARRPTLGAWAANLLARSQPEEARQFVELGGALREAHRTMDSAQLKELSGQQWRVISGLSRQAVQLAQEAGQRLSDSVQREVESTLRAVLADPGAAEQWAAGRLETTLTPPAVPPTGGASTARESGPPTSRPDRAPAGTNDDLAERRRKRREELAQARKDVKAADRTVRARVKDQSAAETELQRTRERREHAHQQVEECEQQLQQARQALQDAEHEQHEAEERHTEASEVLAQAERDAQAATREVDRLSSPGST